MKSKWASRFLGAALAQGATAFVVMSILLYLAVFGVPAASRIVAAGGAGTWLVVGIIAFALSILATAVSALFYQHLEGTLGVAFAGWRTWAAWAHLLLGSIGGPAAALLTAYGGYLGGAALLPATAPVFGGGRDALYVHQNILSPLVVPIAVLSGITLLGFFAGGVGYVTAWMAARKKT